MILSRTDLKQWLKERGITEFDYPTAKRVLYVNIPYDIPSMVKISCVSHGQYVVHGVAAEVRNEQENRS